jgi:hypothetical protein
LVNTDVRGRCYAPAGKTPVTYTVGGTRQNLSMIAAYGFLVTERITASNPAGAKKTFAVRKVPALPADYIPRGSPARAGARIRLNQHNPLPAQLSVDRTPRTMSLLRATKRKSIVATQ